MGIGKAVNFEDLIKWHQKHHRGKKLGYENKGEESFLSCKIETRNPVTGKTGKEQGNDHGTYHNNKAVPEKEGKRIIGPDSDKRPEAHILIDPTDRQGHDPLICFHRRGKHPQDWNNDKKRGYYEETVHNSGLDRSEISIVHF
jgi:hypothetical protein